MGTGIATRYQGGELATYLHEAAPRLRAALPAHFTPEKMIQLLSVVIYKTPELQNCVPESVVTAAIQAGSLDLDLNPGMNEAFLIPRWNKNIGAKEAQFQPGYKGLEKLAVRTGTVRYIQPAEVCRNDVFKVRRDPDTSIFHEVDYHADRGPITHVYAVAKVSDGDRIVEVMDFDEIEGIRLRSQSPNAGPWKNDWKEMACKTLVKRICKRLPRASTPEQARAFEALNAAIEADNRQYEGWGDREHHAANLDNQTGHGRTGAYAPPAVVEQYRTWVKDYVARINGAWLDRVTGRIDPADVPKDCAELLSTWQLSGHVLKWARDAGLIQAPEEARTRQYDPLAAVAWMRDKAAVKEEAKRYCESLYAAKWSKLFPEAEPEGEQQAAPVEAEDLADADPEDDLPDRFNDRGEAWEGPES